MFETAVLPSRYAGRRAWSSFLGMTADAMLVGLAILIPVLFPGALPKPAALTSWIVAPTLPRPEPPAPQPIAAVRVMAPLQAPVGPLVVPRSIPPRPLMIEDPPEAALMRPASAGVPQGDLGASSDVLHRLIAVTPQIQVAPPVIARPPQPAAAPPRVTLGSEVKEAVLLRRVEPVYPPIAVTTRTTGTVELQGVIGTDGRISELRALRGSPMLIPAALAAVRQWIYKPTQLNGVPVEVALVITVNFTLSR